ncbi:hypothetical protein ACOSQ4_016995 [Xanthoceras sorbifolium]
MDAGDKQQSGASAKHEHESGGRVQRIGGFFIRVEVVEFLQLPLTSQVAEAFAILYGMRLTLESSLTHVVIESDALAILNIIYSMCAPSSEIGSESVWLESLLPSMEAVLQADYPALM